MIHIITIDELTKGDDVVTLLAKYAQKGGEHGVIEAGHELLEIEGLPEKDNLNLHTHGYSENCWAYRLILHPSDFLNHWNFRKTIGVYKTRKGLHNATLRVAKRQKALALINPKYPYHVPEYEE